jgi:hypothetical protein
VVTVEPRTSTPSWAVAELERQRRAGRLLALVGDKDGYHLYDEVGRIASGETLVEVVQVAAGNRWRVPRKLIIRELARG